MTPSFVTLFAAVLMTASVPSLATAQSAGSSSGASPTAGAGSGNSPTPSSPAPSGGTPTGKSASGPETPAQATAEKKSDEATKMICKGC